MQRFTIYFCKTLYMFQTVFLSIIRSSKLHIQRQVFFRLIPDAVCAVLSSWWWTEKNRLKHVEHLTETNKLWNVASCWLYSANILAMHGPTNFKCEINRPCSLLNDSHYFKFCEWRETVLIPQNIALFDIRVKCDHTLSV